MIDLPLFSVPRETWQAEVDAILEAEPWLRDKSDRARLIREKNEYIDRYCPEIKDGGDGMIVDVGPGFGVFLELCKACGWVAIGYETNDGIGGMGDRYLQLAKLLCERQGVRQIGRGFRSFKGVCHVDPIPRYRLVNFQGSFAQCHAYWLSGMPHHINRKAEEQRWRFSDDLFLTWRSEFKLIRRTLMLDGELLIVANKTGPSEDHKVYDREICKAADAAGLELVLHLSDWEHKWRKR